MNPARNIQSFFVDLLFPATCAVCGAEGAALCALCMRALEDIPPTCFVCKKISLGMHGARRGQTCAPCLKKTHIRRFLSPFLYESPSIRNIIASLKYQRVQSLAEPMAKLINAYIDRFHIEIPDTACFVPIPLHAKKERIRGFNQSMLLANALGSTRELPVCNILRRERNTRPQSSLTHDERLKNIENAFRSASVPKNTICILVDDVKTTGGTLEASANALANAGARTIWALTFAH